MRDELFVILHQSELISSVGLILVSRVFILEALAIAQVYNYSLAPVQGWHSRPRVWKCCSLPDSHPRYGADRRLGFSPGSGGGGG